MRDRIEWPDGSLVVEPRSYGFDVEFKTSEAYERVIGYLLDQIAFNEPGSEGAELYEVAIEELRKEYVNRDDLRYPWVVPAYIED